MSDWMFDSAMHQDDYAQYSMRFYQDQRPPAHAAVDLPDGNDVPVDNNNTTNNNSDDDAIDTHTLAAPERIGTPPPTALIIPAEIINTSNNIAATHIKTELLLPQPPSTTTPQPPTDAAAFTIKHETLPPPPAQQPMPPMRPSFAAGANTDYSSDQDMFADEEDSDEDLLARAEAQVLVNRTLLEANTRQTASQQHILGRILTDDEILGHFELRPHDGGVVGGDVGDDSGVVMLLGSSDQPAAVDDDAVNMIDLSAESTAPAAEASAATAATSAATVDLSSSACLIVDTQPAPPAVPGSSRRRWPAGRSQTIAPAAAAVVPTATLEISDGEDDDDDVIFVMQVRPAIVPIVDLSDTEDTPPADVTSVVVADAVRSPAAAAAMLPPPVMDAEEEEEDLQQLQQLQQLLRADAAVDPELDATLNAAAAATVARIAAASVSGVAGGAPGVSTQITDAVNDVLEQELADFERECERVRDRQQRAERTEMRQRMAATLEHLHRQQSIVEATESAARRAVEEVRREADRQVLEARHRAEAAERDQMAGGRVIHCAVCLESPFAHQPAATTCGHVFCAACIQQAIRVNRKCPLCNRKLSMRQVHALYV